MLTLVATLLLASLTTACSADPGWSWRQAPAGVVAADPGDPPAPAAQPVATGPLRPLPPGSPRYKYGAKFEPPDGRVLHGMGNWTNGNANYLKALNDPEIEPAMMLYFINIGDWPRPWASRIVTASKMLQAEVAQGRIVHVSLEFRGIDPQTTEEVPVDRDVAGSTHYDDRIRDVAHAIAAAGAPTFVRIGSEFSGEWSGYTPYVYVKAYRHVVDIFRAEKVENAAFVWCWEASSPVDYDEKGEDGWRWYPGDDYVDWFGLDVFNAARFSGQGTRSGKASPFANTLDFLDMAEAHRRPVIVESSAVLVGITPDTTDGQHDWDAWFAPFFKFLADHPIIKAFHYDNSDWKASKSAQRNGWKDADISHNAWIAEHYAQTLRGPMFLNKPDLPLLRGWKPLPKPPAGAAPVGGTGR